MLFVHCYVTCSIGRTGRGGKRGVATTFINNLVDEAVLLDLKHLLIEAKQVVPPALLMLEDPEDLNDGTRMRQRLMCLRLRLRLRLLARFPLPLHASLPTHRACSCTHVSTAEDLGKGCTYCGGLGHRIGTCPKLEHQRKQMGGPRKDFLSGGGEW